MGESTELCAVCEQHEHHDPDAVTSPVSSPQMARVVIEGRALYLCRAHTATVVAAMPVTFEELRSLFTGAALDPGSAPVTLERRSPIARRQPEDRRVFPPRLEGRRMGGGRRAADPRD